MRIQMKMFRDRRVLAVAVTIMLIGATIYIQPSKVSGGVHTREAYTAFHVDTEQYHFRVDTKQHGDTEQYH